jgi:hypothetical protein
MSKRTSSEAGLGGATTGGKKGKAAAKAAELSLHDVAKAIITATVSKSSDSDSYVSQSSLVVLMQAVIPGPVGSKCKTALNQGGEALFGEGWGTKKGTNRAPATAHAYSADLQGQCTRVAFISALTVLPNHQVGAGR